MSQPQQPQIDPKNMIMAIVLSMLIVFGWQYYYAGPAAEKAKQAEAAAQTTTAQLPSTAAAATIEDVATVLAKTKRVKIETPELSGTVNLMGAQLDDLHLNDYRETIDPKSPIITLLKPSGTANAYFVEHGFVGAQGSTVKLPDAKTEWQAAGDAVLTLDKPLTLTWDNGAGLKFERVISISDKYLFDVKQTVSNTSAAAVSLTPFARVQRQDTPEISGFWVFYEGPLGVQKGLEEHKYSALKGDPNVPVTLPATGGWLGFTDKYWATTLIPDQKTKVQNTYRFVKIPGRDAYQTDYLADDAISVPAGGSAVYEEHVYAGAKLVPLIDSIYAKYGFANFDLMIDWGWFKLIAQPMYKLLSFIHSIVGNFGVAILLVTVLVKALVFPLANKSYASMSKMKKLKPEMDAIKTRNPDDRAKQQQETMELYKREKVNPMAGCLPMFVQIPVFFSLYKVILTTIELRHAPFFGWIQDLSAPDPTNMFTLFGLIPWSPPHMLMIGFWPLLMGITMWVQMRLNPAPPDPVQAQMFNWMPVIFTFSLGTFPAGLVIYWAWSNLLSILQQSYIMKKHGTELDLFGNIRDSIPFLKKKPEAA
jgi:YidC/Oxa1 family membrane protein insertase